MSQKSNIVLLIGIDDTDNADSRGTGFLSRQLANMLEISGLGEINGITRHQLFINPAIRYTSQNSSACININTADVDAVSAKCADYLIKNSAPGSDAGLCIAVYDEVNDDIINWGLAAKYKVLNMQDAGELADQTGIYLKGFTGNHEGIIGALSAIGLHAGGNDGRYIWRRGIRELREMESGMYQSQELKEMLALDDIRTLEQVKPMKEDRISINEWVRPILKDHKAVLIIEKTEKQDEYEWKLTPKELIRSIS